MKKFPKGEDDDFSASEARLALCPKNDYDLRQHLGFYDLVKTQISFFVSGLKYALN